MIVLDTNVRRLFARAVRGVEFPADSITADERAMATDLLPDHDADRWAAATMELGAVVCTAKSPRCGSCPIDDRCAWNAAGRPAHTGPPRRGHCLLDVGRFSQNQASSTSTPRYRASKLDGDGCLPKPRCRPNAPARKILRSIHEGACDMARDIAATTPMPPRDGSGRRSRCCSPTSSAS